MSGTTRLGRTLIIANPAAHAGAASGIGARLARFLGMYLHDGQAVELARTERPGHATDIAAGAAGFDTVLAVGGDGIVRETVCGLMDIPRGRRPRLGVVPVGSGNDYARTVGMPEVRSDDDLAALLACEPRELDVGRIVYAGAEGGPDRVGYFAQTLSFGLDAAIALGTYELRLSTGLTGTALYTASGLDVFCRRYRDFPALVSIDGAPAERMRPIIFAMQIGPTYGSGFRICPDADPADGLLDVCYACGPYPRAAALPLFLAAKGGRHVASRRVRMRRAREVELVFEEAGYPIQADGERVAAARLRADVLPGALTVLCRG